MDERARKLSRKRALDDQCAVEHKEWRPSGFDYTARPPLRQFPDDLQSIKCEAMTRSGTPCKRTDIHANGRCKFHGGMSTGTRTEEGKARWCEGYRRWFEEKRRAAKNTH